MCSLRSWRKVSLQPVPEEPERGTWDQDFDSVVRGKDIEGPGEMGQRYWTREDEGVEYLLTSLKTSPGQQEPKVLL